MIELTTTMPTSVEATEQNPSLTSHAHGNDVMGSEAPCSDVVMASTCEKQQGPHSASSPLHTVRPAVALSACSPH